MSSSTTQATPASAGTHTGRIVTVATLVIGFFGAAAPVVLNMDVSSTAGVVAGLIALSAVVVKYLDGWQKYEERLDAVAGGASVTLTPEVTATPGPVASTPPADIAPVGDGFDAEEPPAPAPGEQDDPLDLIGGDDMPDIPDPPTEEEIAAAGADLDGRPGDVPAGNGQAEEQPAA